MAGLDEMLLTQAACSALESGRYLLYPLQGYIGGLPMSAFRFVACRLYERPLPGAPLSNP